jgi:mannose-6-phosphate isomerase-like protein (cupin superfamily)
MRFALNRNDHATEPQRAGRSIAAMTELLHINNHAQTLAPGDLVRTDASRNQLIRVTEGVVYVTREDDEAVLFAGDAITIPSGTPGRAWNAGDETARVFVCDAETGCPEGARLAVLASTA